MSGVLTNQGIVDLQKDLHFRKVLVDTQPNLVDVVSDGRLRNPGEGFREKFLNPVEVIPAIAERIGDVPLGLELNFRPLVRRGCRGTGRSNASAPFRILGL